MPSQKRDMGSFQAEDSAARSNNLRQVDLVTSLRDEHTKVHMEDQSLLQVLRQQEQSKMDNVEDSLMHNVRTNGSVTPADSVTNSPSKIAL